MSMKRKHHKNKPESYSDEPIFSDAPAWLPRGKEWHKLPQQVKTAAAEQIVPLYREAVLAAASAVERIAAETLVYVTWLEVLEQAELGKHLYTPRPRNPLMDSAFQVKVDDFIDRYLHVAQAKQRAGKFLMRVKSQFGALAATAKAEAGNGVAVQRETKPEPAAEAPGERPDIGEALAAWATDAGHAPSQPATGTVQEEEVTSGGGGEEQPLPDSRGSDDDVQPLPDGRGSDCHADSCRPGCAVTACHPAEEPLPDGRGSASNAMEKNGKSRF